LCAWLAAALSAEVGRAHPTFPRYFVLAVPFLAILATVGLYAVASRVWEADQTRWAVAAVSAIMLLGLGKALYDRDQVSDHWPSYERLAKKIDEVTPRDALLFADEPIYFLTRRMPPPGLELSNSHKVDLGPQENALLHILTEADVKREVRSGMFATAYSCDEDDINDYGLVGLYRQRVDMENCSIFWDRKK
jgi:hypothetical protein